MSTEHRDQRGYSTHAVEALLPAVWDEGHILRGPASRNDGTGLRPKTDPRHVPDWWLGCADVQLGFRRAGLSDWERESLRHVVHLGFTPGDLAGHWGCTPETVQAACLSGVERIALYLSGELPRMVS